MPVSEPSKYTTLWAQSGIRFDIPSAADPVTGKAGFDVGFSSINMASESAGGIPPWGQDFNGILFSITRAAQYVQAGGATTFDSSLAAAVGGYAINAKVTSSDGKTVFRCVTNGNNNNPDEDISGWVREADDISDILGLGTAATKDIGIGPGEVPDMSSFLSSSTMQYLPGGWIMQIIPVPSIPALGGIVVNYPTPFPNGVLGIFSGSGATSPNVPSFNTQSIDNLSFKVWNQSGTASTQVGNVLAIGR